MNMFLYYFYINKNYTCPDLPTTSSQCPSMSVHCRPETCVCAGDCTESLLNSRSSFAWWRRQAPCCGWLSLPKTPGWEERGTGWKHKRLKSFLLIFNNMWIMPMNREWVSTHTPVQRVRQYISCFINTYIHNTYNTLYVVPFKRID